MTRTILDFLLKSNPEPDSRFIAGGSNTTGRHWVPVEDWRPWENFTYANLLLIFQKHLFLTWTSPPNIDLCSSYDKEIRDEKSIDLFLGRIVFPVINGALERTSKALKLEEVLYLGPGSIS
jgi:hypothetical protein